MEHKLTGNVQYREYRWSGTVAAVDYCTCSKAFTAVSGSNKQADAIIARKHRAHQRKYGTTR